MTISFIGTGNMGGALARAAVRAGDPQNVALADYSAEKAKALADELGCRFAADNAAAVRASNYILLAVKPQVMKGVLEGIVPVLAECVKNGERKVLVTIAAGLPMSFYREVLGEISIPLIRLMPNTPAAVGQGMTLLTSDGASEDDIAGLERYLREADSGEPARRRRLCDGLRARVHLPLPRRAGGRSGHGRRAARSGARVRGPHRHGNSGSAACDGQAPGAAQG